MQPPVDGQCLHGTQETVLSKVDAWIKSSDLPNVLWISGAAGAGKTALASTIVAGKLHDTEFCNFFIKNRSSTLRDPCVIWRSVALDLTAIFRNVKVDILELMLINEYPKDDIERQFRLLILEPLKRQFSARATPSRTLVVVIDALDECVPGNQRESFLRTIVKWSEELPQTCKLVVTSRPEVEIETRLMEISHLLALNTGDIVSRESDASIELYFRKELKEMEVSNDGWPDPNSIMRLTRCAAGVFAWATTVIEFIRENPVVKLEEVLKDMVEEDTFWNFYALIARLMGLAAGLSVWVATFIGYICGKNPVKKDALGKLYGQILLSVALPLCHSKELDSLTLVLASVILLRKPISKRIILQLLLVSHPQDQSNITSVIDNLRSIILIEGDGGVLRVRHKSFSDFLLDEARFQASMKNVLVNIKKADRESILSAISLTQQRTCLSKVYGSLMDRICAGEMLLHADIRAAAGAVMYVCAHWKDHLQGTEPESSTGSGTHLAPSIETLAFPDLQEHTFRWLKALSEIENITDHKNDYMSVLRSAISPITVSDEGRGEVMEALTSFAKVSFYCNLHRLGFVIDTILAVGPSNYEGHFEIAV